MSEDNNTGCKKEPEITKIELYNIALETRNLEITLFWQRSNYFLVLNTALAVGFFKLGYMPYRLALGIFGILVSGLWFWVNLGSKFWQSRWEQRVKTIEESLGKNIDLFSAVPDTIINDVKKSFGFWKYGGLQRIINSLILKKPSVSRTMIHLSFFFTVLWLVLIICSLWG
jgi:hypothetical protein